VLRQQTYFVRPSFSPARFTGLVWLLIANAVVFLAQVLLGPYVYSATGIVPERLLGLVPALVWKKFYLWQLATYLFLHGGAFHLLFNLFALWMFGRELEAIWGQREFLKYYFLCGIGAGILTVLLTWNSMVPTIGASGAIFGVLLAYGLTFPDRQVYLYFLFPIRAKHLIWIFAALELLASFSYTSDGIGHFAHLGGMLVGFLYLRGGTLWRRLNPPERARFRVISRKSPETPRAGEGRKKEPLRPGLEQEVDRILEKISKLGVESLTPEERATLDEASTAFGSKKG
jgi:membrane associated rhomboid family serine protease